MRIKLYYTIVVSVDGYPEIDFWENEEDMQQQVMNLEEGLEVDPHYGTVSAEVDNDGKVSSIRGY